MLVSPDHLADPEGALLRIDDDHWGPVAVAIIKGQAYAFQDTCTHQECSLSEGFLDEYAVICPCHQSVFDIRTGEVLLGPAATALRTFACVRDGDAVSVSGLPDPSTH
jgi:3-phenylpropionate/trans-cinnamate dioxygenase ferredoxin component